MKNIIEASTWTAILQTFEDSLDVLNEANFGIVLQGPANRTKYLYDTKAWVGQPNTFTADQTFSAQILANNAAVVNGQTGDTNAALKTTVSPTNFKLLWEIETKTAGSGKMRAYVGDALFFTRNAYWTGSQWNADTSSKPATKLSFDLNSRPYVQWGTTASNPITWGFENQLGTHTTQGLNFFSDTTTAATTTISTGSGTILDFPGNPISVQIGCQPNDFVEALFSCKLFIGATLGTTVEFYLALVVGGTPIDFPGTRRRLSTTGNAYELFFDLNGRVQNPGPGNICYVEPRYTVIASGGSSMTVSGGLTLNAKNLASI